MSFRPSTQGPEAPPGPVTASRTEDAVPKATPPAHSFVPLLQNNLLQECVSRTLGNEYRTANIDPAADGAAERVARFEPSVILIEQTLRQLGQEIRRRIQTKMLVCASDASPDLVYDCATLGAEGCLLLNDSSIEDLRRAMRLVLEGGMSYPPSITRAMLEELAAHREHRMHTARKECPLARRELQIVELLAKDRHLANKQLAQKLGISLSTVKQHLHNALTKTSLPSRRALVEHAEECGWIRST